jgi:hypothetical protein
MVRRSIISHKIDRHPAPSKRPLAAGKNHIVLCSKRLRHGYEASHTQTYWNVGYRHIHVLLLPNCNGTGRNLCFGQRGFVRVALLYCCRFHLATGSYVHHQVDVKTGHRRNQLRLTFLNLFNRNVGVPLSNASI